MVLIFWSLFPLLVKYKINRKNVTGTIRDFSFGVFLGAFIPSIFFVETVYLQMLFGSILTIFAIGILNFIGLFFMFSAYSRGKLGIVAPISNAGQSIMIAIFSSLFYVFSSFYKSLIASGILMFGVILMGLGRRSEKNVNRISIYFSTIAAVSWTFMWLIFYTLPQQQSPMVYYWILSGFSLLAALLYFYLGKRNTIKNYSTSR